MPLINCYASLDAVKSRLGLPASNSSEDELLESIIETVSRAIDEEAGTRFYAVEETLYFTATSAGQLDIGDFVAVASVSTDQDGDGTFENAWAPADFVLAPYNAPLLSVPRPYTRIERSSLGSFWFPAGAPRGVRVVGSPGFSTAATRPRAVGTVCEFESVRHFHAIKTPFGATVGDGNTAVFATVSLMNVSKALLAPYRRVSVA